MNRIIVAGSHGSNPYFRKYIPRIPKMKNQMKNPKEYHVVLTILNPNELSDATIDGIAKWLRRQGTFLRKNKNKMAETFKARYMR